MGSGQAEGSRAARRRPGRREGGRAAAVVGDSGGGGGCVGGGRTRRREGDSWGVRGSCCVWVSGWWFRISTGTFQRSSQANFMLSIFSYIYLANASFCSFLHERKKPASKPCPQVRTLPGARGERRRVMGGEAGDKFTTVVPMVEKMGLGF